MTWPRRVLAGVDLGPRSAAVLESAGRLLPASGAHLFVVHCFDARTTADVSGSALSVIAEIDEEAAHRTQRLAALAEEVLGSRRRLAVRVQGGEPVSGLLDAIEAWRPDLVVLGGRRERLLPLCGVSERLSRMSPVPVLLVPSRTPDAASHAEPSAPPARPRLRLVP
jgi:nucleotide-binding universal stress UspA family protein